MLCFFFIRSVFKIPYHSFSFYSSKCDRPIPHSIATSFMYSAIVCTYMCVCIDTLLHTRELTHTLTYVHYTQICLAFYVTYSLITNMLCLLHRYIFVIATFPNLTFSISLMSECHSHGSHVSCMSLLTVKGIFFH